MNRMSMHLRAAAAALAGLTASFVITSGCNGQLRSTPSEITATTSQALSQDGGNDAQSEAGSQPTIVSAPLQLQVLTSSCEADEVQDILQVTNTGNTPVTLSDISIKFWAYDTSGQSLVPHLRKGGCVISSENLAVDEDEDCDNDVDGGTGPHLVSGVIATATQFAPACGPSPNLQANWEITIANTDPSELAPGATWTDILDTPHLADHSNFSPGTADWFSRCPTNSSSYAVSPGFAVYFQGNLVLSGSGFAGITAPACRTPHSAPFPVPNTQPQPQPALNAASDVPGFLQWAYGSRASQVGGARSALLAVQGNESIGQAIVDILNNDNDVGRNLVAISILGELRTQAGLQYFTTLVNTPMPTTGTFGGHEGVPEGYPLEAVALSMLQSRAIDGLALLMSPAADAVILNVIKTTQANQVLARAVHDYLWVHGNDGRTTVAALLDADHQILLDRIDVIASASTYNQRLAGFLAKYPNLNASPPPIPNVTQ